MEGKLCSSGVGGRVGEEKLVISGDVIPYDVMYM